MNDWSRHQLLAVEQALTAWVPADAPAGLGEAMRYAVLDGGKRLRPLLVLASLEACGAHTLSAWMLDAGMRAACAATAPICTLVSNNAPVLQRCISLSC